jgi:uncharacterized membrane protein
MALQVFLPPAVATLRWPLIGIELCLLALVVWANPVRLERDSVAVRWVGLALSLVLVLANASTLVLLLVHLLGGNPMTPVVLVQAGTLIWLTNVVALAVAFWETDRGGPFARDPDGGRSMQRPDLLFPQMTGVPGWPAGTWRPGFSDYLFVAFTSATAFSPTDTMPLSGQAKLLMTIASGVSFLTIGVVLAQAVNAL